METDKINTTALAFVGDAVYEVYVRKHVLERGHYNADALHKASVKYVKAQAQARVMKAFFEGGEGEPLLSPEEIALAKRARNHKTASKAKNADPVDYKNATAFEALLGYLYLNGEIQRLEELILRAFEISEGD